LQSKSNEKTFGGVLKKIFHRATFNNQFLAQGRAEGKKSYVLRVRSGKWLAVERTIFLNTEYRITNDKVTFFRLGLKKRSILSIKFLHFWQ